MDCTAADDAMAAAIPDYVTITMFPELHTARATLFRRDDVPKGVVVAQDARRVVVNRYGVAVTHTPIRATPSSVSRRWFLYEKLSFLVRWAYTTMKMHLSASSCPEFCASCRMTIWMLLVTVNPSSA